MCKLFDNQRKTTSVVKWETKKTPHQPRPLGNPPLRTSGAASPANHLEARKESRSINYQKPVEAQKESFAKTTKTTAKMTITQANVSNFSFFGNFLGVHSPDCRQMREFLTYP